MGDEVQLHVRDLGPIATGTVDLRPLTVLVGPSNTGKTYLSILIYALHRVIGGFRALPIVSRKLYDRAIRLDDPLSGDEYLQVLRGLDDSTKPLMYSDLPRILRAALESDVKESDVETEFELKRCFDATGLSEIVRTSSSESHVEVGLRARSRGIGWQAKMILSDNRNTGEIGVENFVMIPGDRSEQSEVNRRTLRSILEQGRGKPIPMEVLDRWFRPDGEGRSDAIYYLPATRSEGLERSLAISTFSGVMADFMQQIRMYRSEKESDPRLDQIATDLEANTLGGVVRLAPSPADFPEFVFCPHGSDDDVCMTRASSAVSELAPVVLFLRGVLAIGDTLIIEEPEAHLHPAAQTHVAVALARLVRAGVRVVITTHSDWLLKEIGNLMREGVLAEETGKPSTESALSAALHPSEVGVWQFRHGPEEQGSTIQEIPFDRSEGVEPPEYDDVAEALYNRSANLQNKLEESRRGA